MNWTTNPKHQFYILDSDYFIAAQGVQEDVPTDNNNLTIGNLDEKVR